MVMTGALCLDADRRPPPFFLPNSVTEPRVKCDRCQAKAAKLILLPPL
jgi:hypothetical protein